MNTKRPSMFKLTDENTGYINLTLTEKELLTLISVAVFAKKMYAMTANVMRDQGKDEEASTMEINTLTTANIIDFLVTSADPDYPEDKDQIL